MELIKHLQWRYATKKFDPSKKVTGPDLQLLKQAVQLSASSYGLQLYKVLIIEDKALRERLRPLSWGQGQVTDASHLFVFCHPTHIDPSAIDDYMQLVANTRQIAEEQLKGYGDFIKMKLSEKSDEEKTAWMKHQTYIALGNLLAACAELKIDACPMEGFEPEAYDEILNLGEKGFSTSVVATLGYRSETDETQQAPKVRKPMNLLFEER